MLSQNENADFLPNNSSWLSTNLDCLASWIDVFIMLSPFFCPGPQKKGAKKNALGYEKILENCTALAARSKLSRKRNILKSFAPSNSRTCGRSLTFVFRRFFLRPSVDPSMSGLRYYDPCPDVILIWLLFRDFNGSWVIHFLPSLSMPLISGFTSSGLYQD